MERNDVIWLLRRYGKIEREISQAQELAAGEDYIQLLREAKGEISYALLALPYEQRDAVFSHYCKGQQWSQIRWRHSYSDRQIRNISNRGLFALSQRLEDCKSVRALLRKREDGTLL